MAATILPVFIQEKGWVERSRLAHSRGWDDLPLQKTMRWIASNIRTFLLALILAVAVWISAVTSDDPDEQRILKAVPLQIIGKSPSLMDINKSPSTVEVTLRAPRSKWEELTAQENSVQATLDLSGLGSGEYTRSIKIHVLVRPVQIILVNPTTVSVILRKSPLELWRSRNP